MNEHTYYISTKTKLSKIPPDFVQIKILPGLIYMEHFPIRGTVTYDREIEGAEIFGLYTKEETGRPLVN